MHLSYVPQCILGLGEMRGSLKLFSRANVQSLSSFWALNMGGRIRNGRFFNEVYFLCPRATYFWIIILNIISINSFKIYMRLSLSLCLYFPRYTCIRNKERERERVRMGITFVFPVSVAWIVIFIIIVLRQQTFLKSRCIIFSTTLKLKIIITWLLEFLISFFHIFAIYL